MAGKRWEGAACGGRGGAPRLRVAAVDLRQPLLAGFLHAIHLAPQLQLLDLRLQRRLRAVEADRGERRRHDRLGRLAAQRQLRDGAGNAAARSRF
jgi:hypothetical protein